MNHRGDWLFVRVETESGLIGWGEASHSGDDAATAVQIEHLGRQLEGKSIFDRQVEVGTRMGLPAACATSGLEMAFWDLVGKALGQPVYRLLGGKRRDHVRLYANVNRAVVDRSPESYARAAESAAREGFAAIKCAPFDGVTRRTLAEPDGRRALAVGLERVLAIRRAIGWEVDLLVDCHQRFDVPTAILVADGLSRERLWWFEEPLDDEDVDGLLQVRAATRMRIAGGETGLASTDFRPAIERRAVDVAMPDLKYVGGILGASRVAALADAFGVATSPHSPAGPIAAAASAQLCATLPGFLILEHAWGEVPWRSELIGGEPILDSCYTLTDRPGLGVELNEALIEEHAA